MLLRLSIVNAKKLKTRNSSIIQLLENLKNRIAEINLDKATAKIKDSAI